MSVPFVAGWPVAGTRAFPCLLNNAFFAESRADVPQMQHVGGIIRNFFSVVITPIQRVITIPPPLPAPKDNRHTRCRRSRSWPTGRRRHSPRRKRPVHLQRLGQDEHLVQRRHFIAQQDRDAVGRVHFHADRRAGRAFGDLVQIHAPAFRGQGIFVSAALGAFGRQGEFGDEILARLGVGAVEQADRGVVACRSSPCTPA